MRDEEIFFPPYLLQLCTPSLTQVIYPASFPSTLSMIFIFDSCICIYFMGNIIHKDSPTYKKVLGMYTHSWSWEYIYIYVLTSITQLIFSTNHLLHNYTSIYNVYNFKENQMDGRFMYCFLLVELPTPFHADNPVQV